MATWVEVVFASGAAVASDVHPLAIGTVAAAGSNTVASRDDHVHVMGAGCIDNVNLFGAGVVEAAAFADDSVDAAQLKPFTAAINFNGNEAQNMVLHLAAADPDPVVGKVYYNTGDNKVYICTVAA